MKNPWKRFLAKWIQYRIETQLLVANLLGLIVNLAFMGRFRPRGAPPIVVLVDSHREALVLWLLRLLAVIPAQCGIHVIRQPAELYAIAQSSPVGATLVATSRLCSKHYQAMADFRRRQQVNVI